MLTNGNFGHSNSKLLWSLYVKILHRFAVAVPGKNRLQHRCQLCAASKFAQKIASDAPLNCI